MVVHGVVIDHRRMAVHSRHFRPCEASVIQIVMGEVFQGYEGESVGPKAEIEIQADAHAIEPPAEARIEYRVRRHWRPAAIIAGCAPNHPTRSPRRIWFPNPAAPIVQLPP